MSSRVIKRVKEKRKRTYTELSDAEKFKVISLYSQGKSHREIGTLVDMDTRTISNALSLHIKDMTLVQETNKLSKSVKLPTMSAKSSAEITEDFKKDAEEHGLTFGYYLGLTNDARYALKASGLDKGIHKSASTKTKNYILRIRSQYLQSIPAIKDEIATVRKREYTENSIDKPYIISEIVGQLEEEKILREDNPQSRQNSIKLIKLLGDTIGAFSTTLNIKEVDPADSLQALIELAEADIVQEGTYQIEDITNE